MNNYNGMGIYTANTQFDIDEGRLRELKFTDKEIEMLKYVVSCFGKVSVNDLISRGVNERVAKHIKYAYDICSGRVTIDDKFTLKNHLRKMFSSTYKISASDLEPSSVKDINRKCVIMGLNEPWSIWNSNKFKGYEMLYTVTAIGSENIQFITSRIPVLKYKESKEISGVLKIEKNDNGKLLVSINRKYAKLCNRFIVTASLRKPEKYLFLVEIICIEGTSVYVYATDIGGKKKSVRSTNSNRIYDFGVFENEIEQKTMRVASNIYKRMCGVVANKEMGTYDYEQLVDNNSDSYDEEIEM